MNWYTIILHFASGLEEHHHVQAHTIDSAVVTALQYQRHGATVTGLSATVDPS